MGKKTSNKKKNNKKKKKISGQDDTAAATAPLPGTSTAIVDDKLRNLQLDNNNDDDNNDDDNHDGDKNYTFKKGFGPKLIYNVVCIVCLQDTRITKKLYCCKRCNLRLYCSKKCQQMSWKGNLLSKTRDSSFPPHKNWCLPVKGVDKEAAKLTKHIGNAVGKGFLDSCLQIKNMPDAWKYSKYVYKSAFKKHDLHEAVLSCIELDTQRYRKIIDDESQQGGPLGTSFFIDRFCTAFIRGRGTPRDYVLQFSKQEPEWIFLQNPLETRNVVFDEKRLIRFLNHDKVRAWSAWMRFLQTVTEFYFGGFCQNMILEDFLKGFEKSIMNCQLALVHGWVARFVFDGHVKSTWKFICYFHNSYILLTSSRDWNEDLILAAIVREHAKKIMGREYADMYTPLSRLEHSGFENMYSKARKHALARIEAKSINVTDRQLVSSSKGIKNDPP